MNECSTINQAFILQLEDSKKLLEVLPSDLYDKVCETLKIPKLSHAIEKTQKIKGK